MTCSWPLATGVELGCSLSRQIGINKLTDGTFHPVAPHEIIPAGTTFFRVYFRGSRHPVSWRKFRTYGPTDARFDHHLRPPHAQERGIPYVAIHPRTALAEVFQRRRTINTRRLELWLVGFNTVAELKILNLSGLRRTRAGASMDSMLACAALLERAWQGMPPAPAFHRALRDVSF